MSETSYTKLFLKKNEHRRIRAGHRWVFSNEIDTGKTPLKGLTPGQVVLLYSSSGQYLGQAYANPNSLITARVFNFGKPGGTGQLVTQALEQAWCLRESLYTKPFYRLAHAEADGLPGLIIDRYNDVFVLQFNTCGSEQWRETVVNFLTERFSPSALVLRNDTSARELEGLQQQIEYVVGNAPVSVEIEENATQFLVDVSYGQKTGWFYDQRENRALLQKLVKDKSVLDLFCYTGGWGIQAASAGATQVHCVDQSGLALEQVAQNAALNGLTDKVHTTQAELFEYLKQPVTEQYDVVVLDPPALIKRKKDLKNGLNAYQQLNQHALERVKPGGILVSASCSYHLDRECLRQLLVRAGNKTGCSLRLIAQGHQGMDHPVNLAMPETEYLKAFYLQVEKVSVHRP